MECGNVTKLRRLCDGFELHPSKKLSKVLLRRNNGNLNIAFTSQVCARKKRYYNHSQNLFQNATMSCCVMMNMANVLLNFGDHFAFNRLKTIIDEQTHSGKSCEKEQPQVNILQSALQTAGKLKYTIKKITTDDGFSTTQHCPMMCQISSTHVVGVL